MLNVVVIECTGSRFVMIQTFLAIFLEEGVKGLLFCYRKIVFNILAHKIIFKNKKMIRLKNKMKSVKSNQSKPTGKSNKLKAKIK